MRFRAGSTLIYPLLLAITVTSGVALNAGCGGSSSSPKPSSGGTPTPTPTPTPTSAPASKVTVKPTIIWAPRSKVVVTTTNAVSGPASALSVIVTLTSTNPNITGLGPQTFDRGVPVSGGPQTYTTTGQVYPGTYNLSAEFHAGTGGAGPIVGNAAASATVNADGTISVTIATFGTIQSVAVAPGQSVKLGQTITVGYSAFDGSGNIIAISPGSGFVNIADATSTVSGQPSIQVSGEQVTGLNPYHAQITVSVDGVVSTATDIRVLSNVTLDVNPKNAVISVLQPAVFTATIGNDGPVGSNGVTFSIQEGAIAGTLTQPNSTTANFTAGGLSSQGNYHLIATSVYDPNVTLSIPFSVASLVGVTVAPNPAPALSFKGGTQKFVATVALVPQGQDQGVLWSVSPATAGTIGTDGTFTAGNYQGPATVTATSNFDTSKSGSVTFNVTSLTAVAITTVPPKAGISIKTTLPIAATVTGVPAGGDTGVNWSLAPGTNNASIDASGNFIATVPGNYTVIATSRFDTTKTATLVVPVASFVGVAVNGANPAVISINSQHQFTSTVTGVPTGLDTSVAWSIISGTGATIDPNTGIFQAPGTPGNFTVQAQSNFDPTKTATVTVQVSSGNLGVIVH